MTRTRIAVIATAAALAGIAIGGGAVALAQPESQEPDAVVALAGVPATCDQLPPFFGATAAMAVATGGDEQPLTALDVCSSYERGSAVLPALAGWSADAAPTADQCENLREGLAPGSWVLDSSHVAVLSKLGCTNTEARIPN
ncbi:hypothetical protein [Rhodococcus qingshengii]